MRRRGHVVEALGRRPSMRRVWCWAGVGVLWAYPVWAVPPPADTPSGTVKTWSNEPVRTIVYGGDQHFPPYEYYNSSGEPDGFNIALIRSIARERKVKVQVVLRPWPEIRQGVLSGEIDVASMYRSPQRAKEVDFAIPHELIYHEMFTRRGSPPLLGLSSLAGKRVIVQSDTYGQDVLTELGFGDRLVLVPSEPEALRQLAKGGGDVAIVTQSVHRPFDEIRALDQEIFLSGPPVLMAEYSFVTQKNRRMMIEFLNEGVSSLRTSGEYERLYRRWLRPQEDALLVRVVLWTLAAASLAILLFLAWNQSLRRRVALQTAALSREFAEKELAQRALVNAERALRGSQKMEAIGRLAGGVAHDFNNILTIILSYGSFVRSELLARGGATSEIDEILAAAERAARLTQQLLAFSRATPAALVRLDLGQVLEQTSAMLKRLVDESVVVDIEPPQQPAFIEGDLVHVEQILLNLTANARDAMPEGGRLVIRVEEREILSPNAWSIPAGSYVALTVRDTGMGMDQDTQSRIFEPFFTTKALGKGTGLGLATVFAATTRLRGQVVVESAPGSGSTFSVLFPAAPPPAEEVAVARQSVPQSARGRADAVLLVEDDEVVRRAARMALERAGLLVIEAADGEHALELARDRVHVSLVVTDVVMPRLSGVQLVERLRALQPELRVLFVSGYVRDNEPVECAAPGTAFLAKPYTARALVEAVRRISE